MKFAICTPIELADELCEVPFSVVSQVLVQLLLGNNLTQLGVLDGQRKTLVLPGTRSCKSGIPPGT